MPNGDTIWPKSEKSVKNQRIKLTHWMQKRRPSMSKTEHFDLKTSTFWVLQHVRKIMQTNVNISSKWPSNRQNLVTEASQKRGKEENKNKHQQYLLKSVLRATMTKIASGEVYPGRREQRFGAIFGSLFGAASRKPLWTPFITTKSNTKKHVCITCSCTSAFVAAYVLLSR